jgi:hypothetical protein
MLNRETVLAVFVAAAAIALRLPGGSSAELGYFLLALYSLGGNANAIRALGLSWALTMLNDGLVPPLPGGGLGRYVVIGAAALSVVARRNPKDETPSKGKPALSSLALGGGVLVHSMIFSQNQTVSLLKALVWTVAITTLIAAWNRLSSAGREKLEGQLFGGLLMILLVSVPTVVTQVGYHRNGTGFQGILVHSQTFGPVMAVLGTWMAALMLAGRRTSWLWLCAFVVAAVSVLLSLSRTGGLALFLGLPLATIYILATSKTTLRKLLPGLFAGKTHALLLIGAVGFVVAGKTASEGLANWLQKGSSTTSILESYEDSRGQLIEAMIRNIENRPFQGIGFGVASDPSSMILERNDLLGMPTGAAVEKGVFALAIVEELGVFGALAVLSWLLYMLRRAAAGGIVTTASLCAVLLTNLGESTLFSPGGMGMIMLSVVAWSSASGGKKNTAREARA